MSRLEENMDKNRGLIAVAEAAKSDPDIWAEMIPLSAEIEDFMLYRDAKGLRQLAKQLVALADWFDQHPGGGRPSPIMSKPYPTRK